MNSALTRLNIIGMFAVCALIVLSLFANIPLFYHSPDPYVGIHNIQVLTYSKPTYPSPYSHIFMHTTQRANSLILKFDLDVDMRTCVHWGVKQLMLWLVVDYTTTTPPATASGISTSNRVVLWDTIIPYDEMDAEGNIFIEGLEAKYPLRYVDLISFSSSSSFFTCTFYSIHSLALYHFWTTLTNPFCFTRPIVLASTHISISHFFFTLFHLSSSFSELGGQIDFHQPIKFAIQWELTPILGFFSVYSGEQHLKTLDVSHQIGSTLKINR